MSEQIAEYKMKVEDNKMENTKKVSKLEVVKGMITGFAVGKNKKAENEAAKVEVIA